MIHKKLSYSLLLIDMLQVYCHYIYITLHLKNISDSILLWVKFKGYMKSGLSTFWFKKDFPN